MQMVITQIVPLNIYEWAMKSTMKNGSVVFKIKSGSAPLKIEFTNAFCVSFNRRIDSSGGGLSSALTIAPEEINLTRIINVV